MFIQRLAWAGIRLSIGEYNIVIDPLVNTAEATKFLGPTRLPVVPLKEQAVQIALITHLHPDHYDPDALRSCLTPRGRVLCSNEIAPRLNNDKVPHKGVDLYHPITVDNMTFTAVPAVDGLGDDQVSWVIEADGKKFIHCGDTLWHGYWWRIARRFGNFDAAFLPINGALIEFPNYTPSGIPTNMTPAEAVAAGHVLGAHAVVPIHYGMFHNPPVFTEPPRVEQAFVEYAKQRGIIPLVIQPGSAFTWDDDALS